MVVTAVSRPSAPREKATAQEASAPVVDRALEAEQAVQDVGEPVGQARVVDQRSGVGVHDDQAQEQRAGAHQDDVGRRPPSAARVGQRGELVTVAQQRREQRDCEQDAQEGVAVRELGDRTGRQKDDGGPPGPALAPIESVREQQQQHTGTEREGGREGAERAGQHLVDGVHTAVSGAREDARVDVQEGHQGSVRGFRYPARYSLTCPDSHPVPWLRATVVPVPIRAFGDITPSRTVSPGEDPAVPANGKWNAPEATSLSSDDEAILMKSGLLSIHDRSEFPDAL